MAKGWGKSNKGGWVPPSRGSGWIGATPGKGGGGGKKGGCAMAVPQAIGMTALLLLRMAFRRGQEG